MNAAAGMLGREEGRSASIATAACLIDICPPVADSLPIHNSIYCIAVNSMITSVQHCLATLTTSKVRIQLCVKNQIGIWLHFAISDSVKQKKAKKNQNKTHIRYDIPLTTCQLAKL